MPIRPLELVLVDDGSCDATVSTVRDVLTDDVDLRVVRLDGRGPGVARQAGLEAATGALVYFLDIDDVPMGPGIIRLLDALDQDPSAGAAVGNSIATAVGGAEHMVRQPPITERAEAAQAILTRQRPSFVTGAVVVRRPVAIAAGWPPMSVAEDLVFFARLVLLAPVAIVDAPVLRFTIAPTRGHTREARFADDLLCVSGAVRETIERAPIGPSGVALDEEALTAIDAYWHLEAARALLISGDTRGGVRLWREALRRDPRQALQWRRVRKLAVGLARYGWRSGLRATPTSAG
jgi:glycosyltransferase involved in cell wall biosynthesis